MEFESQAEADAAYSEIAGNKYNALDAKHKETFEAFTRFYNRQYAGTQPDTDLPAQLRDPPPPALATEGNGGKTLMVWPEMDGKR